MAADRTTFVGVVLAPEIKALPKILASLPPKQGGGIFKAVIDGEIYFNFEKDFSRELGEIERKREKKSPKTSG